MNDIYQVVYISFASDIFNGEEDIADILALARDRNEEEDITGVLLHRGGVFLQLLEGPEDNVKKVYGSIASDLRHNNLTILVKQTVDKRLFGHWSMAHSDLDDVDLVRMESVMSWKELARRTMDGELIPPEDVLKILKIFKYKVSSQQDMSAA